MSLAVVTNVRSSQSIAIARAFVRDGAELIVSDPDPETARRVASSLLGASEPSPLGLGLDPTDADACARFLGDVTASHG